ncbi:MAG: class I SAM-dependent methyltransferase [Candidatus Eisenbacteria bacterium]
MHEWTDGRNPILEYYDSDFPSRDLGRFPENFDAVVEYQGLAHDVPRYLELAHETGGPVLEPFCGTGRVAIPLARAGFDVTALDLSRPLLGQLDERLELIPEARPHLHIVESDVRGPIPGGPYSLIIIAFNSLTCIADFAGQREAIRSLADALAPEGRLVIDTVNPWRLPVEGDPTPKPFFTRRHPRTGLSYTRFAAMSGFDAEGRQRLHGWYDQLDENGHVSRRHYAVTWRPIARHELQLMLETAGLSMASLEGGHRREPFTAQSPRLFVQARRT